MNQIFSFIAIKTFLPITRGLQDLYQRVRLRFSSHFPQHFNKSCLLCALKESYGAERRKWGSLSHSFKLMPLPLLKSLLPLKCHVLTRSKTREGSLRGEILPSRTKCRRKRTRHNTFFFLDKLLHAEVHCVCLALYTLFFGLPPIY